MHLTPTSKYPLRKVSSLFNSTLKCFHLYLDCNPIITQRAKRNYSLLEIAKLEPHKGRWENVQVGSTRRLKSHLTIDGGEIKVFGRKDEKAATAILLYCTSYVAIMTNIDKLQTCPAVRCYWPTLQLCPGGHFFVCFIITLTNLAALMT